MAKEDLLDTVIKSYQDKLKQNPDSLVFVQLADTYRKKGSYDDGLEACREGLLRHPNLLSALLMMGRIYSAKRQFADAVESLKRVVQREPNNLTAHALLSQSFMALGRYTEAIAEYQKILSLNPEDTAAQQALQEALERMRKESQGGGTAVRPSQPTEAPVRSTAAPAASGEASGPIAVPARAQSDRERSDPPREETNRTGGEGEGRPMEIPAYAAAEELAARGLHEEAIEALQRILEADPDNYMARQKLREVYSQREAMEAPATPAEPARAAGEPPVETHADKISDDEILYLLGLMEGAAAPRPGAAPRPDEVGEAGAAPVVSAPRPAPVQPAPPAAPVHPAAARPAPAPPAPPEPAAAPARVEPTQAGPQRPALRPGDAGPRAEIRTAAGSIAAEPPAPTADVTGTPAPVPGPVDPGPAVGPAATRHVTEILERLAATEGMRQAYLVAGQSIMASGGTLDQVHADKIVTLVRMISDVTKRAAASMKQGEVMQLLMFGTEGMVMVSSARTGVLVAVAGAGVKVGLLRLALNDCLKRLSEVS